MVAAGADYGAGSAEAPERVQVEMVSANPTGPITVASARNGAYGDSVARLLEFAGPPGRARVLLQRRRHADGALPRLGRGRAPRRGAARGRLRRRLHRRARRARRRPGAAHAAQIEASLERFRIHFDSWALQSELASAAPRAARPARHLRARRRPLGALDRLRRREGPRARPLAERGGLPTYEAADIVLPARQARARLRPGDLRPRRRPPRRPRLVRGDRPHARLRPRPRRGDPLPARPPDPGRGRRQDVQAARRRRHPRRAHGRGRRRRRPLVPHHPRPRPDDHDRRRPRAGEEREEPGLLRPVRARPDRRDPPERRGPPRSTGAARRAWLRRSATSSSAWPSSPGSPPRRRSGAARRRCRRTPSASRTTSTASTTTTACWRARRRPSGSRSSRPRRP